MPRVGHAPARHPAATGRAHHGSAGDHDRLRQINVDHRWKIIRLPAAQSRGPRIDRGRRRRKSRRESASGEAGKNPIYFLHLTQWSMITAFFILGGARDSRAWQWRLAIANFA